MERDIQANLRKEIASLEAEQVRTILDLKSQHESAFQ